MFNNQSKNNSTDPKKCVVTSVPKKDDHKVTDPKATDPKKDILKTDHKKDEKVKN